MFYQICRLMLMLGWAGIAIAQEAAPPPLPTTQPIPAPLLDQMYRQELGDLYQPADAEKLYQANLLIERFFAAPDERDGVIQSLEALSLDPNVIGRLTRIRMGWPELSGGVYYINERLGPHEVRYYLGIPPTYDRTRPWPLVIKLPTPDAFIADPMPDPVQVTQIYSTWMIQELRHHPDAIVIMPLLNLDEGWGPSYAGMNSVIQSLRHAGNRVNVDPARVSLLGHGMSAFAAWNLALHYPTYFAAFTALAGGANEDWQRLRVGNLRNVLPVAWHDADDEVVPVRASRDLVRVLRSQRVDVQYEETQNVGHVPTEPIVEQAYQKMRARVRELYPRRVAIQSNRPDTMFNRNDWVQIYQPLNTGQERRLFFSRGTGHMVVYSTTFTIDATLNQNRINVNSRNVGSMRFYVNDRMIDFDRAVTVVLNGRPRFEAVIRPSIEEMLKDQLFLGRGWRYYTGIIDIDFTSP